MRAFQEVTQWDCDYQPNHIYLMDEDKVYAYLRKGATEPQYFKTPWRIDKRKREFVGLKNNPFKPIEVALPSSVIEVKGSTGKVYRVDTVAKTCSCPGYVYRGQCKHIPV